MGNFMIWLAVICGAVWLVLRITTRETGTGRSSQTASGLTGSKTLPPGSTIAGAAAGLAALSAVSTHAGSSSDWSDSESTFSLLDDDDDWITDPTRSYMPGNIYYQDTSCSYSNPNWMTDPCCSMLPGNIYHDDGSSTQSDMSSTFGDDISYQDTSCSYSNPN